MPGILFLRSSFLLVLLATIGAAQGLAPLQGETLGGKPISLPAAALGKPAVLVFSFSRAAGEQVGPWMNTLARMKMNAYSIANLENAPRLIRGIIRSGMRKDTPKDQMERSVLIYSDDKLWRERLSVKKDSEPVVVMIDSAGKVQWTYQGAVSDAAEKELAAKASATR